MDKSYPRFFALTPETTLMDVKRMILEKLRGIFDEAPADDEELNNMVEVQKVVKKNYYKTDYEEIKIDNMNSNESVENSTNATIGQVLEEMQRHESRLILAIILKKTANKGFCTGELEARYTYSR